MTSKVQTLAYRGAMFCLLGMIAMEVGGYEANELVLQSVGLWAGIVGVATIGYASWNVWSGSDA